MFRFNIFLIAYIFSSSLSMSATCDGNKYLSYTSQYQIAYLAGSYDMLEHKNTKIVKCLGTELRMSQLSDSLLIHYKSNPERRLNPCTKELLYLLKKKWNCVL